MSHMEPLPSESSRISVDVDPSLYRLLKHQAMTHEKTIEQYVLSAIEIQLRRDGGDDGNSLTAMTAVDPVLAELWDNPKDAEYDSLGSG